MYETFRRRIGSIAEVLGGENNEEIDFDWVGSGCFRICIGAEL